MEQEAKRQIDNNLATGMNEGKQYQSLEAFLDRDDKTLQERFHNAIREVNNDFRKVLQVKQKDDERKEHHK